MAPTLNAAIVSECIRDGTADKIISSKLEEISRRFMVVKERLSRYTFSGISSGFFIWLNLPDHWTGKEFEFTGRENGVNIFCADKFAVGGEVSPSAIRISLSGAETIDELVEGFKILENILSKEYVGLDLIL